jgi:hypothetical protein
MILLRNNNSLKRLGKIHNETHFHNHHQHHCTIELRNKAASCIHLFHKPSPVTLTTFGNQFTKNGQQNENSHFWKYQQNSGNDQKIKELDLKVKVSPEKRTVL